MSKKGSAKNTKNKAKHARLMAQKKNKITNEKTARKAKLKALQEKINKGQYILAKNLYANPLANSVVPQTIRDEIIIPIVFALKAVLVSTLKI